MTSKRWVAFVGTILLLCVIDTIAIVVTRITPNKYSNVQSNDCVPSWAIFKKIMLEVFNPYVRLL